MILKRARYYDENDKRGLLDQARDIYRNLSEEEKNENRKYGRKRCHNMFRKEKQKLKEYQNIIVKSLNLINKIVF